ncbi:MAG: hypothetical protein HOE19_04725 [Candidatus Komeilibacteria bacterium]|jgi:hypothetical protein|nr:hypothetical protein [Candidatus Komeilibacteria bacterium]MBT4447973.1 hypothetical protein [Candidatus Komeilibacteria bacterium]
MDSSNNKVIDILDKNNWSDTLLVKDTKGNLKPLKDNKKKKKDTLSTQQSSAVSEGSLAPKDDNFVSMQNIMGTSQDKSELVFHPEDKEEVDFIAQNMYQDDSKKYSVEKIVYRIIEKQKLNLDSKNKKIFTNILYNFFRNRKSAVITRELLTNSVLIKNKKISAQIIDIILSVIKSIKNKIDAAGGLVVNNAELKTEADLSAAKEKKAAQQVKKIESIPEPEDKELSAQDEIKNALGELSIAKPDLKPVEKSKSESKLEEKKEVKVAKPKPEKSKPSKGFSIPLAGEDVSAKKPEVKPKPVEKSKPELKKEEAPTPVIETSLPKVSRPGVSQAPKKAIADVITSVKEESKPEPVLTKSVLTGPVQELQSFDLVGFRRLGNTASERTQKILDKINLLEQESYTKKAQGITAWRESSAYKLYLQLGAESMIAGKEVAEFIAEYENKNKDTLSTEEFSAISDLNKQLRF